MKTRILVSEQGIADAQTGTGDKPEVLRRSVIGELCTVQSRKLTVRDEQTRYKIDKQSEYGKKSRKSEVTGYGFFRILDAESLQYSAAGT